MPKANSGTFKYPGGKTTLAPWIISHFPEHECYVEPFGGSASVLYQKPKSDIEVYNDLDSALVNLFEVIRDRPDDLREWLEQTPHSREIHRKFASAGVDPAEGSAVKCAGRMFYLLQTSYSGKLNNPSFNAGKSKESAHSPAEILHRSVQNIPHITDRFNTVTIESLPYGDCIEKYDAEGTLFYIDPPYVTKGNHYRVGSEFDHGRLVDALDGISGKFVLSYDTLPEGLDGYTVVTRERKWTVSRGSDETEGTEKLVMNYDPDKVPQFSEPGQSTLSEVA